MMPNKIFHEWVQTRLHLLLCVLILIPLSLANGVVSNAAVYMIGGLSAIPADITMASYAFTIGLVIGIPLILSLKQVISSKVLLLGVFTGLILVNIILANTDQPLILVMASFAAGFFKINGLLEILATLLPILMPKGERYRLYAVYYPVTLIFAQLTTMLVVAGADQLGWEFGQLALNVPLLLGVLIIIAFVHPRFLGEKIPLYRYDWLGLLFTAIAMLLFDFVLAYGQTEDWFLSSKIVLSLIFGLLALSLRISRTVIMERPFLDFKALQYKNVIFGLVVMFILSLFFAASNIQGIMMGVILKNNPVEITRINLYMIFGFIVATLIGFFYYRKYNNFKVIIIGVVSCYAMSFILLFFLTSTLTTSQDFYLPMFFRGVAILLSYMAIGIYVSEGVPFQHFFATVFYYLSIRTFIGPAIWSSFLSNLYYRRMIYNVDLLASKIDSTDPYQRERYEPVYHNAIVHGSSSNQAADLFTRGIFSNVQAQASLLTIKEIYGMIIVISLICIGGLLLANVYQTKGSKDEDGFVLP